MNIKRLKRIEKRILKAPKQFKMSEWMAKDPVCGTTCCIGGAALAELGCKAKSILPRWWTRADGPKARNMETVIINPNGNPLRDVENSARIALGLDESQAERLFHDYLWPKVFAVPYEKAVAARDSDAAAAIAVARIEYFIHTKGTDIEG